MQVLVITGGIGSGKSEVCRLLAQIGINAQYDADRRVKGLYVTHPTLLSAIEESLETVLRDEVGNFVPSRLAERIFSDKKALEVVESLVFPALIDDFETFVLENSDENVVVFESATILQKPQFDGFGDKVIYVDAPVEIRIERSCARDGASAESVRERMANQLASPSDLVASGRVDAVLVNDGSRAQLKARLIEIMSELFGSDADINNN